MDEDLSSTLSWSARLVCNAFPLPDTQVDDTSLRITDTSVAGTYMELGLSLSADRSPTSLSLSSISQDVTQANVASDRALGCLHRQDRPPTFRTGA